MRVICAKSSVVIIERNEGGTTVEEICREAGISSATYINWTTTCAFPAAAGGWDINAKSTYLINNELGMQLRNKTPTIGVKAKPRENRAARSGTKSQLNRWNYQTRPASLYDLSA